MNILLFLIIFLLTVPLTNETSADRPQEFVVWNVGQGQWATHVQQKICTHFDAGGEFAPFKKIKTFCNHKKNEFWISHWDKDHFIFLTSKFLRLTDICIRAPNFEPSEKWKNKIVKLIPNCVLTESSRISEIYAGKKSKDTNTESRIISLDKKILMPGDSTEKEEKIWAIKAPRSTEILLLGHHGSKTSTSTLLLRHLTDLKMAIASARKAKYNHPHPKIRLLLLSHRIP
ncbi:MAG: hypothetical protein AB7H97_17105, partial [Pseudobdellovibrionaceae bacterium]